MENKELDLIVRKVEEYKEKEATILQKSIAQDLVTYEKNFSKELITPDFQTEIEKEVQTQVAEFRKNIDLNPKALYYALKVQSELNPDITEVELKKSAYDFLEKTTKNSFLKKIIKELKKEI